ncbi:MAG: hypothetical protein JNL38_35185 [Myxococcales bacterium]|nr:hypothetical protein [Myxococcales bacterium]
MIRRRRCLVGVFALAPLSGLVACNGLTGVGELQLVECAGCVEAGVEDDGGRPPLRADSGAPRPDAGSTGDAAADAPALGPDLCRGVTFFAALDGSGTSGAVRASAKAGEPASGNYVTEPAGKRGQGFRANAPSSTLTWSSPYQGITALRADQGTAAFYLRLNFNGFPEPRRAWLQPLAGMAAASPTVAISGNDLVVTGEAAATASVDLTQIPGVLATRPWLLVVVTWRAAAAAGAPSLGVVVYAPTQTLSASYKSPWAPGAAPTGFRLGFNGTDGSNASFDELVLWDRALDDAEIKQVSELATPIDQACP